LHPAPTLRIDELTAEERAVFATLKPDCMPQHVAIIMDGNGRWAGHRSLKRFLGHQQGAKSVQLVTETASRIGLPWLTLYAFSLENNLRRPRAEVSFLMRLLKSYLVTNIQRMMDNNVRIRYIGRTHELSPDVQDKMQWASETTARNTGTSTTSRCRRADACAESVWVSSTCMAGALSSTPRGKTTKKFGCIRRQSTSRRLATRPVGAVRFHWTGKKLVKVV